MRSDFPQWCVPKFFPMALLALTLPGCWSSSSSEVVVYTALDSEFSEPILKDFSARSGVICLPKFDVESTKTVGLANAILLEFNRPRCDVFWNNEILHTLLLDQQGLLAEYRPAVAGSYPAEFCSQRGTWYGFAARARVLLVNTERVKESERPTSVLDLADPQWKGRTAIAKPLFGTTATHAACLFAVWGDSKAKEFFHRLKENRVQVLSGNKQVALAVAAGQAAFGLTDTDDASIEVDHGRPVKIVYPDQGQDQMGTLFIPNTLAIVRGCPHAEAARRLIDYLLSPEVERRLALCESRQIPLGANVDRKDLNLPPPASTRPMKVDFEAAAKMWHATAEFLTAEFAK